jgi:predicted transcriptional regulator
LATTTTIRVALSDRDLAQELATGSGRSQMEIVHEALELYRRHQLLAEMNRGFADLRRDADAWSEEMMERDVWDVTLGDATGGD